MENVYNIEINNTDRYDFDYIEKILRENVKSEAELVFGDTTGFNSEYFNECHSIWYPDKCTIIMIAKIKEDKSNDFVNEMREFNGAQVKRLSGTGLSYLFSDFKHTVVNGYTIYMVCDNADVALKKVINYMQVEDELAVKEYTDKYYTTDDGAFLKESAKIETSGVE